MTEFCVRTTEAAVRGLEDVQVTVIPVEGDLNQRVQPGQRDVPGHLKATPDRRTGSSQPDFDPVDGGRPGGLLPLGRQGGGAGSRYGTSSSTPRYAVQQRGDRGDVQFAVVPVTGQAGRLRQRPQPTAQEQGERRVAGAFLVVEEVVHVAVLVVVGTDLQCLLYGATEVGRLNLLVPDGDAIGPQVGLERMARTIPLVGVDQEYLLRSTTIEGIEHHERGQRPAGPLEHAGQQEGLPHRVEELAALLCHDRGVQLCEPGRRVDPGLGEPASRLCREAARVAVADRGDAGEHGACRWRGYRLQCRHEQLR